MYEIHRNDMGYRIPDFPWTMANLYFNTNCDRAVLNAMADGERDGTVSHSDMADFWLVVGGLILKDGVVCMQHFTPSADIREYDKIAFTPAVLIDD